MAKERSMEDALHSMNELIEMQQKAIRIADDLMKLKDSRLDVADRLITIYKKENKILVISLYSLIAFNIIVSLISLL